MLSGSYVDAERGPLRGSVQFTPISIGANGNDVVIDRPVYVRVDDGTFSVDLIPSTDPGWNTTGDVFYRVYEDIGGQKRSYVIAVPAGDSDIKDLQPIDDPQYVLAQPADALLPDPSAAPDDKWIKTTSGAYILTDAPSGTATPSDSTPSDVVDTATPGVSAALSRADHAHGGVTQSEFDAHGHTGTDDHAHAAYSPTSHDHAGTYEPSGAVSTHEAGTSHDSRYYTEAETDALLAGKENSHSHPYEPSGAVSTHEAAGDPHSQYVTDAEHALIDHTGLPGVGAGGGDHLDSDHADAFSPLGHGHTLSDVTDAGTAAALDVPATGDAAAGEIVKGDDTRLTNARTPVAHDHNADYDPLGSAASAQTAAEATAATALTAHHDPSSTDHDDRYYTEGEIDTFLAGKEDTGVAASAVTTHEGAVDPHSQYAEDGDNLTTGFTQTTTHGNLPLMPVWTGTQTALDGITQVAGVIYLVTGP